MDELIITLIKMGAGGATGIALATKKRDKG